MPDPLRRIGAFVGALAAVAGVLAVVGLVSGVIRGEVSGRVLIAAAIGVVAVVLVARTVSVPRLLGGYSAIVYIVLFAPILVVVIYAFNAGRYTAVWDGFSTKRFSQALSDDAITSAIGRSFRIGISTAIVSTILGTAGGLAI